MGSKVPMHSVSGSRFGEKSWKKVNLTSEAKYPRGSLSWEFVLHFQIVFAQQDQKAFHDQSIGSSKICNMG